MIAPLFTTIEGSVLVSDIHAEPAVILKCTDVHSGQFNHTTEPLDGMPPSSEVVRYIQFDVEHEYGVRYTQRIEAGYGVLLDLYHQLEQLLDIEAHPSMDEFR